MIHEWVPACCCRNNILVAVHAGLSGRNRCEAGLLNRVMAVPAIHPQLTHVKCMTVGNGLLGHVASVDGLGEAPKLIMRTTRKSETAAPAYPA